MVEQVITMNWWDKSGIVPEQEQHASPECFEIDHLVKGSRVGNMSEKGHPNNGIDESDER